MYTIVQHDKLYTIIHLCDCTKEQCTLLYNMIQYTLVTVQKSSVIYCITWYSIHLWLYKRAVEVFVNHDRLDAADSRDLNTGNCTVSLYSSQCTVYSVQYVQCELYPLLYSSMPVGRLAGRVNMTAAMASGSKELQTGLDNLSGDVCIHRKLSRWS